jgi:DNA-binding transcriptional LysR family regulator
VTIRQLETQLGVTLLERSGRQLEVTEAGRLLLDHGRHAPATVQQAAEAAMSAGGRLAGTPTIGCSYDAQQAVAERDGHRAPRVRAPASARHRRAALRGRCSAAQHRRRNDASRRVSRARAWSDAGVWGDRYG